MALTEGVPQVTAIIVAEQRSPSAADLSPVVIGVIKRKKKIPSWKDISKCVVFTDKFSSDICLPICPTPIFSFSKPTWGFLYHIWCFCAAGPSLRLQNFHLNLFSLSFSFFFSTCFPHTVSASLLDLLPLFFRALQNQIKNLYCKARFLREDRYNLIVKSCILSNDTQKLLCYF